MTILGTTIKRHEHDVMALFLQSGRQTSHHPFGTASVKRMDDAGNFQGRTRVKAKPVWQICMGFRENADVGD
jgi:hypothetical protein